MKNQRIAYLLFAIWVIALASTPWIANNYIVKIATFLAMYAAIALSWNFIGGFAGYPSFATGAFIGLGATLGHYFRIPAGLHHSPGGQRW